jgi:hypothetical protein
MRKIQLLLVAAIAVGVVAAQAATAEAFELEGPQFEAERYPAAITATSSGDVWTMFGANVECTVNTFAGTLTEQSPILNVTPTYGSCHAFGVFPTILTTSADNYTLHSNSGGSTGTVDVNSAITINVYESAKKHEENKPMCVVTVPAQSGLGPVTYTNGAGTVNVSSTVKNIAATQVRNSIFCPAGASTSTATYAIQPAGITNSATNGGTADPIDVG